MSTAKICRDNSIRRRLVRERGEDQHNLNGIDYIEVDEQDQKTLNVYLFAPVPEQLLEEKKHIRIDGGARIRTIQIDDVLPCDDTANNCMQVKVDKAGDFSTYTLSLVNVDEKGHQTTDPLTGFDVRYASCAFTFNAGCPSDFDCAHVDTCPPAQVADPEIDYLAKDYSSFRQLLLDRLSVVMPEWKERHIPDIGIVLTEVLAYVGDYLSYYQDAVATEAYLETARQRISVRRHVRLVDYTMHEGCNARTWLAITASDDIQLVLQDVYFITGLDITGLDGVVPLDSMLLAENVQTLVSTAYEAFEPLALPGETGGVRQLYAAQSQISFYTWDGQECCLPLNATNATLIDAHGKANSAAETQLHLQVGDVLIFEEVIGPETGNLADADPTHRHAVRLTKVEKSQDDLHNPAIPLVEIAWAQEDALPFPLCLSTLGPPPGCKEITDISVARGNVLLVDHGLSVIGENVIESESLKSVPTIGSVAVCKGVEELSEVESTPGVFRPHLQQTPLTFAEPLSGNNLLISATRLLHQDVRGALPSIKLTGTLPPDNPNDIMEHEKLPNNYEDADDDLEQDDGVPISTDETWQVRYDLLESHALDADFVIEMDNDRVAHLRFGDGELGKMPAAGTTFNANYRIGNGSAGNVGAETISSIVFRTQLPENNVQLLPRNLFAASGGVDPELLSEVKLFAPHTFRTDIQRAITADDYALIAERTPGVQRAAATLRWMGSWYEVQVAIDQNGTDEIDPLLLQAVAANLEQYRRIGHDLQVVPATFVALYLEITVCVLPNYLRGHVEAALLDLLSNRILRNGQRGFFHPDNLTFGQGIALSKIVALLLTVTGVRNVTINHFQRLDGGDDFVDIGFLPLGSLEIGRLDNDRNFPENGNIVVHMEGGR